MKVVICSKDHPWPVNESTDAAGYLRDLADRIERGEIDHVSLSVHPNK